MEGVLCLSAVCVPRVAQPFNILLEKFLVAGFPRLCALGYGHERSPAPDRNLCAFWPGADRNKCRDLGPMIRPAGSAQRSSSAPS